MLMPKHQILGTRGAAMSPRKLMIIGAVGMIHVLAVYALINGMATKALQNIARDIEVVRVQTEDPPKVVVAPPTVKIDQPTTPVERTIAPPVIDIAPDKDATPIYTPLANPSNQTTPSVDSAAAGIMNTHSIPPYPTEARALSHQGTVVLSMSVSASGDVVNATVAQSSGYTELDQAAIAWVIAHWKYKPALQAGQPMPSQTQAAVKFDLKLAHG
jgi:protein TonB